MLEARTHKQLKHLLLRHSSPWPHHLTLSRLVARSLRRQDHTLIQLEPSSKDLWWLALLVPLCLETNKAVLILSKQQRRRLLKVELPLLQSEGFQLACWEGAVPPSGNQLWLMNPIELIEAHQQGHLKSRQLIIPEAEHLSTRLRAAMALSITPHDWEQLRRAHPSADASLMQLHERISRSLFTHATRIDAQVRLDGSEIMALKDLMRLLGPSPSPWPALLKTDSRFWASWAELDHKLLQWRWHLEPLEPLQNLPGLLRDQPTVLLTGSKPKDLVRAELDAAEFPATVVATLSEPNLQEPIPLFAPRRQPLPNTEIYAEHLLDQCRRLILGRKNISVVLLNDQQLRHQLTSELAAEFGRRVVHETTAPESNGVICCRWAWWLEHHEQLPLPEQIIVALLPLASVESPLTAARVECLKHQGRDWFRDLLLPEALSLLAPAVDPLRKSQGRLAILDGRIRGRSWGKHVLRALEPWTPLQRLLPD
ncbi:MAG: helicase [Prochlorococcus sp.]|jgi:ATP-dependent DNA helicase DinG|nr:helicase [Prochlorococcaceae cyanobacterium ETNP2_MAG_10]